jgi:RimJ/RimL family protein N-acetyltransferase
LPTPRLSASNPSRFGAAQYTSPYSAGAGTERRRGRGSAGDDPPAGATVAGAPGPGARRRRDGPAPYPAELKRDIALRDGTTLRLRPIRADDAPRLVEYYGRLSAHTAYQRFFTVMRRLPPDWARLHAAVDYWTQLALIAERGPREQPELIAVARYEPTDRPDTAEVAFVVQDAWQGKGLGTIMLEAMLAAADARGITRFRAFVLADNARMLRLLRRFTDVQERAVDSGVVELVFRRRPAPAARPA